MQRFWCEVSFNVKVKTKFCYRLNNCKINIERIQRVIRKFLRNYFTLTFVSLATEALQIGILYFLSNEKRMHNWKERETFWQHRLKYSQKNILEVSIILYILFFRILFFFTNFHLFTCFYNLIFPFLGMSHISIFLPNMS